MILWKNHWSLKATANQIRHASMWDWHGAAMCEENTTKSINI